MNFSFKFNIFQFQAVMGDMSKPEEFVAHLGRILPDADANEVQRILEMRGSALRRADQQQILQLFRSSQQGQGGGFFAFLRI